MSDTPGPQSDKLRVFVSSCISECSEERNIARASIESLNHDSVLFEHIGARSQTPREVYISKLEQSQIFVGIYKRSYGWVGPGMSISGIEDEYRCATQRGLPRLIYVHRDDSNRERRLCDLLDEIKADLTISFYQQPENLYERIRNDVEAEVAQRFYQAAKLEALIETGPASYVKSVLLPASQLVRRNGIETAILAATDEGNPVQVVGPMGIGKTILLATLAQNESFIFIPANGLSRKELAGTLANRIRGLTGKRIQYFVDAASAFYSCVDAWKRAESLTLVIDGVSDPGFIDDLFRETGGTNKEKRLIYSQREATESGSHTRIVIPPLSDPEIAELVLKTRGSQIETAELKRLQELSRGIPLYIRYYLAGRPEQFQDSISAFETEYWHSLKPRAKEIVGYLSVTDYRLTLSDLSDLLEGSSASVEEIIGHIEGARLLIQEDSFGYSIVHEHLRTTIRELIASQPQRLSYYSKRVARLLLNRGEFVEAYFILTRAGDVTAKKIARSAQFQASQQGDFARLPVILENELQDARERADKQEIVMTLLALSQANRYSGDSLSAQELLKEASAIATASHNSALMLRVREEEAWHRAQKVLDDESVGQFQSLKATYKSLGDDWSYARIALDLSVIMLRVDKFIEAKKEAEEALEVFEKSKDSYGISIARRNLISALLGMSGQESRIAELMRGMEMGPESDLTQRERAWLCNVLTRRHRKAGDPLRAREYALEAISIGEKLADGYVIAINHINLGNTFRDESKFSQALEHYQIAGNAAQKCGDKNLEASSGRLMAVVYNETGKWDLAMQHALYAAGIAKGTLATDEYAYSLVELANARKAAGDPVKAASDYIEAAIAFQGHDRDESLRLGLRALSLFAERNLKHEYLSGLDRLFGTIQSPSSEKMAFGQELFDRIPEMLRSVNRDEAIGYFGIHFRLMLENLPPLIARHLFQRITKEILERQVSSHEIWRTLFPLIPLLVSVPKGSLRLDDLVVMGDELNRRVEGIHFKPYSDGSAHWVVLLSLSKATIISISCLEDRVDTSIVAALLVSFLKGFEKEIQEQVILSEQFPTTQVAVTVCNLEEMPPDLRSLVQPQLGDQICGVSRPTSPEAADQVPTVVICRGDIADHWHAGTGKGSVLQLILGKALVEIVFQLLRGQVEFETLEPKIVNIIRRTVS